MSPTTSPYLARRLAAAPRDAVAPPSTAAAASAPASLRARPDRDDVLLSTHWTRCLYCDPIWPRPRRARRPLLTSGLALVAIYAALHLAVGGVLAAVSWLGPSAPVVGDLRARLIGAPAAVTR
jgi:hypothetical protein